MLMKWKWQKKSSRLRTFNCSNSVEAIPVAIVADATIASRGTVEGRLIPLLILDTSARPDIVELVRISGTQPPGDVRCQWGQIVGNDDSVSLILSFERPAELFMVLQFEIVRQGILVDQILNSHAVYIQPGKKGDRYITTIDNQRILIEVPDTHFQSEWDRLFLKHLVQDMRKNGLQRQQAKQAARSLIEELRQFGKFRMKRL
jgi:hypothetical protein